MIRRRYNCAFLKVFTLLWCCLVVLFLFNYQTTHNERLIQLEKEMSQKQEIQEIQVTKSQNKVSSNKITTYLLCINNQYQFGCGILKRGS